MVKDEVGLVDEKVHVRGADGIFWNSSDRFVKPNHVIADIAKSPTRKGYIRLEIFLDRHLIEVIQRVSVNDLVILCENSVLVLNFVNRIIGDDGISGVFFFARNTFKNNFMFTCQAFVSKNWC